MTNKLFKITAISLCALTLAGCNSMPSQGEMLGGVAGAVVGSRFGGGSGRLVATGVGALVGSSIGRSMEGGRQPQAVYGGQPIGTDPCVQMQMSNGDSYGQAASYCQGRRQRQLIEQERMQQDAYRRGYNGQ